jgi:putative Holliday junction resolvase
MAIGRVLAVDPGSHRVGLALSDESATVATPLRTLDADPAATLPDRIAAVAREVAAAEVVVGLPRRLDGSYGPEAAAARRLAGELRAATRLPVAVYDERLSTTQAERELLARGMRRRRRREVVDQVAAALILQSFLERRGGRGF